MWHVDGNQTGGIVLATSIGLEWGPERKPNKARFKAAVVGCMRASREDELEMWAGLLREEIALWQELEELHEEDSNEIEAFLGRDGEGEGCVCFRPADQETDRRSAGDDWALGAMG